MRLIDAHHHLWNLGAVRYPWLNARGVQRFFGDPTAIQRNYGVEDLRRDAPGIEILQSVHVQVGCAAGEELEETRWLDSIGPRDGLPTAIIASVDLTRPDVEECLSAQTEFARVRGARQIVGREPADDVHTGCGRVLADPAFLRGLRALAAHGLAFDLQLTAPQLPLVAALLDQVPELRVALCHCGSPWDQSRDGLQAWRQGLAQLARRPQVSCKLSGLSMFDPQWTSSGFGEIVQVVLEVFGPQRCMFGSNFPVDGLHRPYADIVAATRQAVQAAGLGAAGEAAVFIDTARTFYRL